VLVVLAVLGRQVAVLVVLAVLRRQVAVLSVLVVLVGLTAGSLGYLVGESFVSCGPHRGRN
jgi:hypothetical protein